MPLSRITLTGLSLAFIVAPVLPATAQSLNLTLAGASPGGLWTLLGAGLDAVVKANDPNSTITYQTTGGGFANAAMISEGRAEIGLIHDAELAIAAQGGEPFSAPIENLRTIGYLYDWAPMQFVTTRSFAEEHEVDSVDDFAAAQVPVRMTVNRAGNITGQIASAIMAAAGADDEAIAQWGGAVVQAGSSEQAGLLQNGRVDLYANGVFVGHSSIREIENALDIKLLSIPADVRAQIAEEFSIAEFTIPADSYENQPEAIETLALGAVLIASAEMSEEDAYTLTKALIDNLDSIRSVHPAMADLDTTLLTRETAVPYHDGALRAYQEAGLIE
ncbi:MAG: hypothetical protein CL555_08390 [Algoriphagus sp.]|nr:hypothetical protein [Algoriphagus sp.]|tara:strand:- start:2272 stop:3267 length:996 start_codon:yes stop_codon:yes gene_type:complete|eukprot:jgi/Tetstr1/450966/TSEL_038002.t1